MQFDFFFPRWMPLVLFLGIAAWSYGCYHRVRDKLPQRTRYLLTTLRLAAVSVLLFCLLAPALTFQEKLYPRPHLLVLIDRSESMSVRDASTDTAPSRLERALRILQESLSRLRERFEVHLYAFDESATTVDALDALQPDAPATDIPTSVDEALREWRGQTVEGVLVLTDGQNTVANISPPEGKVPIYAVGFGAMQPPKDVKVGKVNAPPVAYVDHAFDLSVRIRHHGFQGERVPIHLIAGNRTLATQRIALTPSQPEQEVRFQVTPPAPGTVTYRIEVPPVPGELTSANNVQYTSVRVVRAKLRVFYLEGSPRWESRFLKRALEEDPNVELTFSVWSNRPRTTWRNSLLERTGGYYPHDGMPTPFPERLEDLLRYDVILFGDIAPQRLRSAQAEALLRFVEERGRSVVFLAGPTAVGPRGWQTTPLASLLPVQIADRGARLLALDFRPTLTLLGQHHPITQLGGDSVAAWEALPTLSTLYQGVTPKVGTVVLAEHPLGAQRIPLIAIQRTGRGRTLWIGSDSLWNWAFQGAAFGMDDAQYRRFWSQAIRWLASYTDAQRVNVSSDRSVYSLNATARVQVRTYDANYRPTRVSEVQLRLTLPDGKAIALFPTEREEGVYEVQVSLAQPGTYRVQAQVPSLGEDSAEWLVEVPSAEFDAVERNEAWLQAFAERTGGRYVPEENVAELIDSLQPSGEPVVLTRTEPMWDSPWLFLAVVGFLGVEWFLRKRQGLV